MRLSYATSLDIIEKGLDRFEEFTKTLQARYLSPLKTFFDFSALSSQRIVAVIVTKQYFALFYPIFAHFPP